MTKETKLEMMVMKTTERERGERLVHIQRNKNSEYTSCFVGCDKVEGNKEEEEEEEAKTNEAWDVFVDIDDGVGVGLDSVDDSGSGGVMNMSDYIDLCGDSESDDEEDEDEMSLTLKLK